MRPADSWRDYELLDATNHNRLERWGQTLLIRPDPQVIWKNDETSPLWAKADAVYYRSAKGGGQWNYHKKLPQKWQIHWNDLTLIVSPTGSPEDLPAHGDHMVLFAQGPGQGMGLALPVVSAGDPQQARADQNRHSVSSFPFRQA